MAAAASLCAAANASALSTRFEPAAADFGARAVGSTELRNLELVVEDGMFTPSFSVVGTGFTLAGTNCPFTLTGAPVARCTVTIGFTPPAAGSYAGTLKSGAAAEASLIGAGTAPATSSVTATVPRPPSARKKCRRKPGAARKRCRRRR